MKIVTYNIHKGMDSNDKLTLCEIGKYLKNLNCSIICLQEILYHQYLKLKKILKIEGVFVANVKKTTMLYGICIFSQNRIISHEHILLTSKKEQRGFIYLSIFNKEQINIINTHLGLDKEERVVQIDEILNFKNKFEGKTIICGDFNEKNIYINTFKDSASVDNGYKIATFSKSKSRIDYIYIENGIKIKNYFVDEINLSDHYPVIVQIEK